MRNPLRLAAVAAAGLLVATIAGPAAAAPDDRGAGWLSDQLTDGLVVYPQYGDYVDYGGTADTALALTLIGGHQADLDDIEVALSENVDTWTTSEDDINAGSVAKAVVAAQTLGADPRDFGGVDLLQRLEQRVSDQAPNVGRLRDLTAGADYNNTFSQALGARGLARAGSDQADEVLGFLLKQQCSEGFFRLNFAAVDATKQGCNAGDATTSAPDTDATAMAVVSLRALPKAARTDAVRGAVGDAVAWLKRTQKKNGSFGGGVTTEPSNSNSTGLAGWALGEAGACVKAKKAAQWVRDLQVPVDVSGTPLEGETGAIAYSHSAYQEAQEVGITDDTEYQWRLATVQAAPALSYLRCG